MSEKFPVEKYIRDAIEQGDNNSFVQLIAEDHERINIQTVFGTWLHEASINNQIEIVKKILNLGFDINTIGVAFKNNAICDAISENHFEVVKYLVSQGAELNNAGNTLLHAIENDRTEIFKYLVEHGADVHKVYKDSNGDPINALSFSERYGREEISSFLRSKGVTTDNLTYERTEKSFSEDVVMYFEQNFGTVQKEALKQILPDGIPIAIHRIAPDPSDMETDCWTLFTTGMSEQPMNTAQNQEDFQRAEIYIQLPSDWKFDEKSLQDPNYNWPIQWLRNMARYPHENSTWFGGPFTIITAEEPPQPLAPNLQMTCMMLAANESFSTMAGHTVRNTVQLYHLQPLYTEEREMEIKDGLEALLDAFDENLIGRIFEADRPNVALTIS